MSETIADAAESNRDDSNPGSGEFVSNYLLYLLAAASDAASGQFHETVREAGLRVPEWRVLACLTDRDGAMITQLARFATVEQSRLTQIIMQMDDRGLVSRRGDPEDRRRVRVFLTDKGRALASGLVAQAREHEDGLMKILANSDAARLKPALHSLIRTLDPQSESDPQAEGDR